MLRHLALVCLATTLVPAASRAQVVRTVPGQYPTIAAALAAAATGDTIAVAPGTYAENLVWPAVQGIRLVAIAGPSVTTLDAGAAGRAIEFPSGSAVTRSTIVEGFTIRNGLLATTRNHGAGLYIDGSPTIRGNVIRDHVCDGPNWNYGGAIHVAGGAPRIIDNVIENNACRNGSWNYGAGIYVTSLSSGGAATEILRNTIRGNSCVAGSRANGVGVYVDSNANVVMAGNVVAGNTANSLYYNYGVALHVNGLSASSAAPHSVQVANNTFAANTIVSTTRPYGAVYLSGAGIGFHNNIVAGNTPSGIYQDSLGTAVASGFNCVWGNGTDYVNTGPAATDLAVDPLFVSTTDFGLTPASPCIDAGSNADVPTAADLDVDGDPRRCDGDLDGAQGNGARVDVGADEFCAVHLTQSGPLQVGSVTFFDTSAPAGWSAFTMIAFDAGNLLLEPFGNVTVGSTFVAFGIAPTPNRTPIPIPAIPALTGLQTYVQSGAFAPGFPSLGSFSNMLTPIVW